MDFGEAANRGQILGRALQDEFQLLLRLFELLKLDERAPERHARREISGMNGQPGAADIHRFLQLTAASVFLGQLRESDR